MASQDNYRVVVTYDGQPAGVWDGHSGGEKTHDNQTYRRASTGIMVAQPARATYGDLTLMVLAGEYPEIERRMLTDKISRPMTAAVYPLGTDGVVDPRRSRTLYIGRFAGITMPDSDINGTDTSTLEVTMTVEDVQ